jgi:toxin ParE1/3/4
MKLVFTAAALADLDNVLAYTAKHYPASLTALRTRMDAILERIRTYPKSGRLLDNAPAVRVVPLLRFPFRVFYRESADRIEILHIHHTARESPFDPR